jgi:hypothetical protein
MLLATDENDGLINLFAINNFLISVNISKIEVGENLLIVRRPDSYRVNTSRTRLG